MSNLIAHLKGDPAAFAQFVLDNQLQPWQVRTLSLLKKQIKDFSRRAPNDHSVSVDMHRLDIRAISATRLTPSAISIEEER